jgi:pyruvate-formate lyase-activating enzyme
MTFIACARDCGACPFPPDPDDRSAWAACIPWPASGDVAWPAGDPGLVVSWLDMESTTPDQVAAGLRALVALAAQGRTVSPLLPVDQFVMLTEQDPHWTGVTHGLRLLGLTNGAEERDGPWERFDAVDGTCGKRINRFTGQGFALLSVRAPADEAGPDEPHEPMACPDEADPWIDELDWPDRRQLVLRATGQCNLACPHCFVPRFGEPAAARLDEALDRILDDDDGRPVDLAISGGEPLVADCLGRIAARLGEAEGQTNLRVSIQTNATLATDNEALLAALARDGRASALVNLPSFDPDTYAAMTGGAGQLDDALAGIDALRGLGWTVTVNRVLTRRNLDQGAAYLAEVARRWGDGVRVTLSSLSPDTPREVLRDDGLPYAQAGAAIGEAVDRARDLGVVLVFAGGDCAPPACCLPEELVDEGTWFQQARQPVVTAAGSFERGQRYLAPSCGDCLYSDRCPGISARYARQFGLDDLRPVQG